MNKQQGYFIATRKTICNRLQFTPTPDFVLIYDDLVSIATIDAHKMPQSRHFGSDSNTMQQVHGAGEKK